MSKFSTTSSELFNKKIVSDVPEWMQSLANDIQVKDKPALSIDFDKKGSFEDSLTINRTNINATPRIMEAGLNSDRMSIEAKIELSKFLKGKYYKTQANVQNNYVYLDTQIDGIQANFNFPYRFENGKLSKNEVFTINDSEYPFSAAGLEESLLDLKKGTLKKAQTKVASTSKTFVINREEIIRRFNGSLREATDAINQHLKEGTIIGAGSNSYASYYDPDVLFPQVEKAVPQMPTGSFEFVNNTEHVAANEHKSAKKLSIEASKMISNLFSSYMVNNTIRDKDELLLDTVVLNDKTGMRHKVSFNFKIKNEKLAKLQFAEVNNERLSIEQLLSKLNMKSNLVSQYLKSSTASKHITAGMIFTERDLKNKLSIIVGTDNATNVINAWVNSSLLNPINSTTYSSKNTFEELLNEIECDTLTAEQIEKINNYKKKFGEGMDVTKIDQKDTGIRDADDIELSEELKLSKINSALSKHFKNYQIVAADNKSVTVRFASNGVRHSVKLYPKFNNRKLEELNAIINNTTVGINRLSAAFKNNAALQIYIQDNKANNFSTNIIASENSLLRRLSEIVANPEEVLAEWKQNYLQEIGNGLYSSSNTFEELLNESNCEALTAEQIREINERKKTFGEGMDLSKIDQEDTGVRESDDVELSDELKLSKINSMLSKYFKNYQIMSTDGDTLIIRFASNGVRHSVKLCSHFNGRKLEKLSAIINNNNVDISKLSTAFKNNEVLQAYIQDNKTNNFASNIVASEKGLLRRLANLVSNPEEVLSVWKQNYLQEIGNGMYSSSNTFEELLNETTADILSEQDKKEILLAKQYFGNALTKMATKDTGIRDLESRINNETLLYEANNYLSRQFANYNINNFVQRSENVCVGSINVFDDSLGLSTNVDLAFGFENGKVKECKAIINNKTVSIKNVKKAFALNETLNKYLQINSGKKFNSSMVITKNDLKRRLSAITNADDNEIDNMIELWKKHGKVHQLNENTLASKVSLEQLISMSNIKPLSDKEIVDKLDRHRRDRGMALSANYIKDNDTRHVEETWSLEKIVLHARAVINSMFADFDIIDADLDDNNNYVIVARIINPINGLKQSLKFNFITFNGTKLGDIKSISNGEKTVTCDKILELLESDNVAINRFITLNSVNNKRHKNVISRNNLKTKLLTMIDPNETDNVINKLVSASIINPIDNFNFASKYSFPELIQYLSKTNNLDLNAAEQKLKSYNKDAIVDTNIKHVKETDTRLLEKKEDKLTPDLIKTCEKLNKLIANAHNTKKITNNKFNDLSNKLEISKNGHDIEEVWRELKRYL